MISSHLSNRLVFIFSLLGLLVAGFLFYEYNLSGPIVCPTGAGCDTVRASSYSRFLGISIPVWGIAFYLGMAILSVVASQKTFVKIVTKLQLVGAVAGVGFGVYLSYLEVFVIRAICFWCVLSFIISVAILLSVLLVRKKNYDNRN